MAGDDDEVFTFIHGNPPNGSLECRWGMNAL